MRAACCLAGLLFPCSPQQQWPTASAKPGRQIERALLPAAPPALQGPGSSVGDEPQVVPPLHHPLLPAAAHRGAGLLWRCAPLGGGAGWGGAGRGHLSCRRCARAGGGRSSSPGVEPPGGWPFNPPPAQPYTWSHPCGRKPVCYEQCLGPAALQPGGQQGETTRGQQQYRHIDQIKHRRLWWLPACAGEAAGLRQGSVSLLLESPHFSPCVAAAKMLGRRELTPRLAGIPPRLVLSACAALCCALLRYRRGAAAVCGEDGSGREARQQPGAGPAGVSPHKCAGPRWGQCAGVQVRPGRRCGQEESLGRLGGACRRGV